MDIISIANSISKYLSSLPDVKNCVIYGSIAENTYDAYSDIDIELDVSGCDNSLYALKIPELLDNEFPIIFYDYAPSLMPESYVVSCALSVENPFLMVDIKCIAAPHFSTLLKSDFPYDRLEHTLKVFVANLKHMIRGVDCYDDIFRMHSRVCKTSNSLSLEEMMENVFEWLEDNAAAHLKDFVESLRRYL